MAYLVGMHPAFLRARLKPQLRFRWSVAAHACDLSRPPTEGTELHLVPSQNAFRPGQTLTVILYEKSEIDTENSGIEWDSMTLFDCLFK